MAQITQSEIKEATRGLPLSKFQELYMAKPINAKPDTPERFVEIFVDMSRIVGDVCSWVAVKGRTIIDSGEFKRARHNNENRAIITEIAQRWRIDYKSVKIDE